jgi:FkbM family methyltransferase
VRSRFIRAWKRRVWLQVLRKVHPEITVAVNDSSLMIDLRDSVVGSLLYLEGEYEKTITGLLARADLRGRVCLDIGANIGLHTITLSKLVGDEGRVFAFEPAPDNFKFLKANVRKNHCRNVRCLQVAVGNTVGNCKLALNPTNFGDHRVAQATQEATSINVAMTTVDKVLHALPDETIGLIKMDVQGFEMQVLQGMTETLNRNSNAILLVEVFPEGLQQAGYSAGELVRFLRSLDFDGWEIHESRLIPLLQSSAYDLIRDGKYVDLLLGREPRELDRILGESLHQISAR